MKTYLQNTFLIILATLLLSSCQTAYYYPTQQNVPLLAEQGETKVVASGAISTGNKPILSGELNLAHALTDHFFISGNGALLNNDDELGYLADLGAGYYTKLTDEPDYKWIFELQAAGGYGKPWQRSSVEFYRFYVQPAIGVRRRNIETAFSCRFTGFYLKNTRPRPNLPDNNFDNFRRSEFGSHLLAEPSFTLRFGSGNIKFHQQVNLNLNLTNRYFTSNPISASIGLSILLPYNNEPQIISE